jgi:hypothetical protein
VGIGMNIHTLRAAVGRERHTLGALEHVIGQHLSESQQVVIQVFNGDVADAGKPASNPQSLQSPTLPEWCNVYEGLSDAEIANIESSIVRSHDSRSVL